jgi:hypothetical protein
MSLLDELPELPEVPLPSPSLRERLIGSVQRETFAPFGGRLARLFDVSLERAQEYLAKIPQNWEAAPWEGVQWMHLPGGPSTEGCDVGFVKMEENLHFPYHSHKGLERVLILQGGFTDSDGTLRRAGDLIERVEAHSFVVLPGKPLVYAVVFPGVEFPENPDAEAAVSR